MANRIAIIGGGAAGFFAAIHAAQGENEVYIFEKTNKLLSKVRISGGGRCNVTHDCDYASKLINYYPRGGKSLRKAFELFGTKDTRGWYESRGIALKTESDGRVFPVSNSSQTIIDCLVKEAQNTGVNIKLKSEVKAIKVVESGFKLTVNSEELLFNKVIVASGGSAKKSAYTWLEQLGLKIASPLPSLFTFNTPDYGLKELMGLSVPIGSVQIPATRWKEEGPVLITHWGFSGPAILKMSAWAAKDLYDMNYQFPILINWTCLPEEEIRKDLQKFKRENPKKKVISHNLFNIPSRLWTTICQKAEVDKQQLYLDISKKKLNKLVEYLVRDPFKVNGKTTFKEEFVSCGGVELSELNLKTFEAKKIPGLYLIGELINVDGVTGGFNFQHAWTSGYLAGVHAAG